MKNKSALIESGLSKIVRKMMNEGTGLIDKKSYNRARKGIELLMNSLFDLQNIAVDDPQKAEKKAKYDEIRTHVVAIRELLDEMVK